MDPKVSREPIKKEFKVEMCVAFNYSTVVIAENAADAIKLATAECMEEHSSLDCEIDEITYVSKGEVRPTA